MVKKRCTQKLLTELLHKIYMLFLLELIVTLEAVNSKKKKNPQNNFLPLLFHFTGKKQAQKYRAPATKKGCLCCKIISTGSPPC